MAVANRILLNKDQYGESGEDLAESWAKWIHHIPFDSPVARRLAELYTKRLENLDEEKDAGAYRRLQRKLNLVKSRAARYNIASFSQ